MFGKRERDIGRLESATDRIEKRVDDSQRDMSGLSSRLDQRIDSLNELMTEMQTQNSREHARVMNALDNMNETVGDKIELVDSQVKDLTVKIGLEVGRIRSAADTVETQKRVWQSFASGEFFARYRVVVIVVLVVLLLLLGVKVGPQVEHWLSGLLG